MSKEELEKEACEGYIKRIRQVGVKDNYRNQTYNDGYLDGAEPREKRIAELEQKLETERSSRIALVNKIAELEKENAELNFKLKKAVKILKECAEYEDLTCYADILEEIEVFLKSVDIII